MEGDRENQRWHRQPHLPKAQAQTPRRRRDAALSVEPLEGRLLLALTTSQQVRFGGTIYTITVDGPGGLFATSSPRSGATLTLLGTSSATNVTVSLTQSSHLSRTSELPISRIIVRTKALGSFQGLNTVDLNGPITPLKGNVTSLQFDDLGPRTSINVRGTLGQLQTSGNVDLGPNGGIRVDGDVLNPIAIGGHLNIDGGQFRVGRDASNAMTINGDLTIDEGGHFIVGRDIGSLQVNGDTIIGQGSSINIGRSIGAMTILGDLDTSTGGTLFVGGNLDELNVGGIIRGKLDQDILVGLDLGNLVVQGATPNSGGIQNANIDITKDLLGLQVLHGIFNSLITVGVAIDGGSTPDEDDFSIGPDGPVAVFNSTITAGVQIRNLVINGDVKSDRPTNPNGRPTRIVAGMDKFGALHLGGNLEQFQITGSLIDAVVAASIAPGPNQIYDQPAGTITGSIGEDENGDPIVLTFLNYTAPPYAGFTDDIILSGSINAAFAPPSVPQPPPFPTTSTVLGGVITTTPHVSNTDFAGLFATFTAGVFVGRLPG